MDIPLLIGLNGFKNVGKDTVAQFLIDNHDFKRIAFADKLKEAAAALFDVDPDLWDLVKNDPNVKVVLYEDLDGSSYSELTAREFLKRFGTQMGRDVFGKNFWVDAVLPLKDALTAKADNQFHGNRVVTDARFENELYRIKRLGGYNVRIIRPGFEGDAHASEQAPAEYLIDYTIVNDGSLDFLRVATKQMYSYLAEKDSLV